MKYKIVYPLIIPFVFLYQKISYFRFLFYKFGLFRSYKVNCPVVSIGNLEMGGTGKTPFVIWLADVLLKKGYKVTVLTRGYKREDENWLVLVDKESKNYTPSMIGDEPAMIKKAVPGITLACDSDRVNGAKKAIKQFNPDILILDDGFQHHRLNRDIDILLLPPSFNVLKRDFFFMGQRADFIIQSGDYFPLFLKKTDEKVLKVKRELQNPVSLSSGKSISYQKLQKKRTAALAAIASPQRFFRMLETKQISLVKNYKFKNHYDFTQNDVDNIEEVLNNQKIDYLLCTEKDSIKLKNLKLSAKWCDVRMELQIPEGKKIIDRIESIIKNHRI